MDFVTHIQTKTIADKAWNAAIEAAAEQVYKGGPEFSGLAYVQDRILKLRKLETKT